MEIRKIPVVKSDDRGVILDCGEVHLVRRIAGTISANHYHDDPETIYFIEGKAELKVGDETCTVEAPAMTGFGPGVFHGITALTDIVFIYRRDFSQEK